MNINVTQKNPDGLLPCPACGCEDLLSDWGCTEEHYGKPWRNFYIDCGSAECYYGIAIECDGDAIGGSTRAIEDILKQTWNAVAAILLLCKTTQ